MKPLSIKDIAKIAKVAPSTVSFVINGKAKEMRISDELSRKILKIVHDTGYVPNKSAVTLRTGKTFVIGLIVEDISNNFFATLAKSIEDSAYKAGYNVLYGSTENNDEKGSALIRILNEQVDGFLITPSKGMKTAILQLKKSRKPVVLLDRYFSDVDLPHVLVNNERAVEEGVDLLVRRGYKKLAFVVTALDMVHMKERLRAFENRLKTISEFHPHLVLKLPYDTSEQAYEHEIKKFLLANPSIDAIFFATNYLAIKGLRVIQQLKWRIPDRISVLSFDDHEFFKLYTPSITAIDQPIIDLANKSVDVLISEMSEAPGVNSQQPHLFLDANLILRSSV